MNKDNPVNVSREDYERHFGGEEFKQKEQPKPVSVVENILRVGRFTSGEAFRLMSNGTTKGSYGKPYYSYIHEKNLERKLGRSLSLDKGDQSTKWGKFLEGRVNDLLPVPYELMSNITMEHPKHGDIWVGTQDTVCKKERIVCDTKCYEPKNFAEYNDMLIKAVKTGDLTEFKKDYAKEFWQLVSNACIWDFDLMEVDVYMPYESELAAIKDAAYNYDGDNPWEFRFIFEYPKSKLAYLPDGNKFYKNLNRYLFEVSKEDKEALTNRVVEAGKSLLTPLTVASLAT